MKITKHKITAVLLTLALAMVIFTGCGGGESGGGGDTGGAGEVQAASEQPQETPAKAPAGNWEQATFEGVSFVADADWHYIEDYLGTDVYGIPGPGRHDPEEQYTIALFVDSTMFYRFNTSADEWFEEKIDKHKADPDKYEIISLEKPTINDMPALEINFIQNSEEDSQTAMHYLTCIAIQEKIYEFSFMIGNPTEEEIAYMEPIIEHVISSVAPSPETETFIYSALSLDEKKAFLEPLTSPEGEFTLEKFDEREARIFYDVRFDDAVAWYEDALDGLGFVSTVSEETRSDLSPFMAELFTGTIDGEPLTLVVQNLPPPPEWERWYTLVVIRFFAYLD